MGKKSLLIGAAIGYVLGARAGRERYDQIASAVSRLWNDPKVKAKVDQAQTTAVDTAKSAAASAKDAAANSPTVQAVKDGLPGSGTSSSSTTTPASGTASTGAGTAGTSQPGSTTPLTPTTGSNAGGRP